MKKLFLVLFVVFSMNLFAGIDNPSNNKECVTIDSESEMGAVFRSNQYLKSSDGREIQLLTSGVCKMYEDDRLVATCTYSYNPQEKYVHIYVDGEELYKARVWMKKDGMNISHILLAGTYYRS